MPSDTKLEVHDIQAVLRGGLGRWPTAGFLLLRIADAPTAARWLRSLPVSTAEKVEPSDPLLQVAFTSAGLTALRLPASIHAQFSLEFRAGLAGEENRSRRLGDVGDSAPSRWEWGGTAEQLPHVLLMCYARGDELESRLVQLDAQATAHGLACLRRLDCAYLDGKEPFGFVDGISQPDVDWDRRRDPTRGDPATYSNDIALGEFVLGYPNEYGQYTDRPLVADAGADLPLTEDPAHRGLKDLGRNGTYLVLRRLAQDVRGFWQYLHAQAAGDATTRDRLAECMVGRRKDGNPLPGFANHEFTYETDPDGRVSPLGAHIRRANPRNGDLPYGAHGAWRALMARLGFGRDGVRGDLVASSRFHRLLRRGRKYGPTLTTEDALQPAPPGDPERGLNFISLNASLSRQFEFVQNAWMMTTTFDGLRGEGDPLAGSRATVPGAPPADGFSLREGAGRQRLSGMPRFISVRGGAYFFLPGIRALRYLLGGASA